MELWIRSQDKIKLVKVNYIYIMESNGHFTMYGETIDSSPIIGTYKSKERALEVLDEINDIKFYKYIASLDFNNFIKAINKYNEKEQQELLSKMNTFEMPKE